MPIIYSWSNIDGAVTIFKSIPDVIKNENWDYLEDYSDSADIYEVGQLVRIKKSEISKYARSHTIFVKLLHGDTVLELTDTINSLIITSVYYGKRFISTIPTLAREKLIQKWKRAR